MGQISVTAGIPTPRAERILATVLFTDIVGSTELATRLGDTRWRTVLERHEEILRDQVDAAGGRLVDMTGDGSLSVFDGPAQAIHCAQAIIEAVGALDLQVRTGLHTGECEQRGERLSGLAVHIGARVGAKAGASEVWVSRTVRDLVIGSSLRFRSRGAQELKGVEGTWELFSLDQTGEDPDAVTVPTAVDAAATGVSVPFPLRLTAPAESALVGRQAEWALLEEALDSARAGSQRVVLVGGEPGIGKSRLTAEASRTAFGMGTIVLYGRSDEDLGIPFQPWAEAIGHLVEHLPIALLAAHVAEHGGELARLVPVLGRRLSDVPPPLPSDPETERYLLFQAVTGLVAQCAQEAPIVLLLDDLHWSDKPTLLLLRHLISQSGTVPLLILGTYRDSDVVKGSALSDTLAALRRESGIERMSLAGLDDDGVLALFESAAGHEIDAAGVSLAQEVLRETAGNPFFVGEILRYLTESGTISQGNDGRWTVRQQADEIFLPESVREVVGQRVRRLGDDVVRTLSAASLIGRDFELSLLAQVLAEPEDDVCARLEEACAAALVQEIEGVEDRFTFHHALVQHALDADLNARHRRQLHQRIAEVIEETCGADPSERVGELASHWLAASGPNAAAKALFYARLAGERSWSRLAADEAVRWFGAAASLAAQAPNSDPEERCALLIQLGRAQRLAAVPTYWETLLEAAQLAQVLENPELLAEAALASNSGHWHAAGSVDQEQFEILEAALTAIGPEDSTTRARLLALYALGPFGRDNSAERLRIADEAVAMARRIGDDACLLEVLVANHVSGRTAERLPALVAEEPAILELAERVGNRQQLVLVYGYAYSQRLEMGDLEQADRHLERMAEIADEVTNPLLRWMVTSYRCTRLIVSGSGDEVEAAALAARQLGQDADLTDTLFWFDAQIYSARWKQGRLAEAVDLVRHNMAEHPEMPVYRAQLAYTLTRMGERAEAIQLVDDFTFGLSSAFPDDFLRLTSQCYVAEACVILGTAEQAAHHYTLLAPYADRFPCVGTSIRYSVSLVLAVLAARTGQHERAEQHFADAEAHHVRMGARGWLARSRLEWGRFLIAQGDAGRARPLLAQARDAATEVGAADVVGAAEALLAEIA